MDPLDEEPVELFGTLSKTDSWRLQRYYFPSKVGGFPSWLDPVNLPSESDLKCDRCSSIMTFFLQIYSPDDTFEENEAFHRTIFLFVCQPCGNEWKVFRSQLARKNDFYDFNPLEDNITLPDSEMSKRCCLACGLPSEKVSSDPLPELNGMKIQLLDSEEFRELHGRCKIAVKHQTLSSTLEEWLINICEGEISVPEDYYAHENELYRRYLNEKMMNGEPMDESEERAFESIQEENEILDKSFKKFSKKTTRDEVIYYSRDGEPLWISDRSPRPVIEGPEKDTDQGSEDTHRGPGKPTLDLELPKRPFVPVCENCGGVRSFEFQVLPQILHFLKSDRLDFASIAIYTCSKSCKIANRYQREVVVVEKDYSMLPRGSNSK